MSLVNEVADREILINIGFGDNELDKVLTEFQEKFADIDTSEPVLPIAPRFNEKHNYILIVTNKEIDHTWLTNLLELGKQKCYKSENTGIGKVISVLDFQKLYKRWTSK